MPRAAMSQRRMPPNTLTSTRLTLGSDRMMLTALATFSSSAPPPTSKKLAGAAPAALVTSRVAIAKPAPLTRQPTLPSKLT